MRDYDVSVYGDRIADVYDDRGAALDPTDAVATLAGLAGAGPVLELGIGTGRLALPLAERGLDVHGIDASEAMVERLREKPGGERIPVTIGDFADVEVGGSYSLVFAAANTFFGILTQDDQVRCFGNVAARLTGLGVVVLEAFVPDVTRFERGQHLAVRAVELHSITVSASTHDPVTQTIDVQDVEVGEAGARLYPARLRYAWPSELDLMARVAGLRLRERWSGWRREPFTQASTRHVSVYERA